MPLDKYGRVIVSPDIPLGLSEFARLYSTEGATPEAAASNIHLNYPTEAKSRLADAWSALGINQSPEQYFSQPLNFTPPPTTTGGRAPSGVVAPGQAGPALFALGANGMPQYQNDIQRQTALALGVTRPEYATPQLAQLGDALAASSAADRAKMEAYTRSQRPIYSQGMSDEQLLAAQLTGDSADVKEFLMRKQGINPEFQVGLSSKIRTPIKPYRPTHLGKLPGDRSGNLSLDENLLTDPDFDAIRRRDPSRASYIYEALTGRPLEADAKESYALRDEQIKSGRAFARRQIEQGATRDPVSGKWKVWMMDEAPQGILGGAGRPYRQLIPATEDQNRLLDEYYSSVDGRSLPAMLTATTGQKQGAAMEDIQGVIAKTEKDLNRDLTPQEKMQILYRMRNQPRTVSGIEHVGSEWARAGEYVLDAGKAATGVLRDYTPTCLLVSGLYDWFTK